MIRKIKILRTSKKPVIENISNYPDNMTNKSYYAIKFSKRDTARMLTEARKVVSDKTLLMVLNKLIGNHGILKKIEFSLHTSSSMKNAIILKEDDGIVKIQKDGINTFESWIHHSRYFDWENEKNVKKILKNMLHNDQPIVINIDGLLCSESSIFRQQMYRIFYPLIYVNCQDYQNKYVFIPEKYFKDVEKVEKNSIYGFMVCDNKYKKG